MAESHTASGPAHGDSVAVDAHPTHAGQSEPSEVTGRHNQETTDSGSFTASMAPSRSPSPVVSESSHSPSELGPGCAYDLPMAYNGQSSYTPGLEPQDMTQRRKLLISDSRACTVGPMPVQYFIDEFLRPLPPGTNDILSSRAAFKQVPSSAATPSEIYEPLIEALNKSTKHKSRAPGLVFENASARSEHPHKPSYMKPHICCYTSANAEVVRQSDFTSRAELGYAELFIEVKPHVAMDFFVDPPTGATDDEIACHEFVARPTDKKLRDRIDRAYGQHTSYAVEILALQARVFLFSISISGSSARLFRWDRSGVVVTRSFDIHERPDLLCDFIGRFGSAHHTGRGHDHTVMIAPPDEEALFRDSITNHVREQLGVSGEDLTKAVSEHYQRGHIMAIHVAHLDPGTPRKRIERYLVSRPVVSPLYHTGRGTRGYWAVEEHTGRVVFLKDTWRSPHAKEGDIIAGLNAADVYHVPLLVAHGDVHWEGYSAGSTLLSQNPQATMSERYDRQPWVCLVRGKKVSLSTHIHYRMVLGTVGYDVKRFRGTDELLRATYDVFHSMRDALQKDSRLHRDISAGNIILVQEGTSSSRSGYLVDWEVSSRVDEKGCSLNTERAGTWKFMSYKVLGNPEKPHIFQDDMESLFYVVLYCALLHLPHSLSPDALRAALYDMFDRCSNTFGFLRGGDGKVANATLRIWTDRFTFKNTDLQTWVNTVMDYHCPPRDRRDELAGRWTNPDYLDSFWGAFLQEHSLPRDDRVDNSVAKLRRLRNQTDSSLVPFILPARPPPTPKRKAEATAPATRRKRARLPEAVLPLRRSKRLEHVTRHSKMIPANGALPP